MNPNLDDADLAGLPLPDSARNLLRLLGTRYALALMQSKLAGATILFAATAPRATGNGIYARIAAVIGDAGLRTLALHYAGSELYIPRCGKAVLAVRDRLIVQRYDALTSTGASGKAAIRELVAEFDLSDRQIRTIVNSTALPAEPCSTKQVEQMTLF